MKKNRLAALSIFILVCIISSCVSISDDIADVILNDPENYFYINVDNYPANRALLPVGVFDSGTGGLTVMDAIVQFDAFNNETGAAVVNGDGVPDFQKEQFVYLGDQANMPYGNYGAENKTDLLQEHILKDMQFLLGNKYYETPVSVNYKEDKLPVKSIVIACNTATAFGKEKIEEFMETSGLDIMVIGVIGAGVRGALSKIGKNEKCSIGVMATAGTVASKGYVKTIEQYIDELNYAGDISVFQQAGIGVAGAIDRSPEYISATAVKPYSEYRGPSFTHGAAKIDKRLLARYDFIWDDNRILFDGSCENPAEIQLNSVENYFKYHLVSLLEQLRQNEPVKPLKVIILGCTHYPFYMKQIQQELQRLYEYEEDGEKIYRPYMNRSIELVDPAINTAKELYEYLKETESLNNSDINKSEFYISVPNLANPNILLDKDGRFTYDFKYGRFAGEIQKYVKCVPFSRKTIDAETVTRLSTEIPVVYQLIHEFNRKNPKTRFLSPEQRL